jgi:hypothetical protein
MCKFLASLLMKQPQLFQWISGNAIFPGSSTGGFQPAGLVDLNQKKT